MLYWEKNGIFLSFLATDAVCASGWTRRGRGIGQNDGRRAAPSPTTPSFSPAGFRRSPSAHRASGLGEGGFHDVTDCMDRVNPDNLYLMRKTLAKLYRGILNAGDRP